jgi:hypothetical protein
MGRDEPGNSQPIINEWKGEWVVPGSEEDGLSCPWARVWITYTHLQLNRRLREREECSTWNTIVSQIFSKCPKLSLILACLSRFNLQHHKKKKSTVGKKVFKSYWNQNLSCGSQHHHSGKMLFCMRLGLMLLRLASNSFFFFFFFLILKIRCKETWFKVWLLHREVWQQQQREEKPGISNEDTEYISFWSKVRPLDVSHFCPRSSYHHEDPVSKESLW